MRIFHISDTHGRHNEVEIPHLVDILVHSGDSTNYHNPIENLKELKSFTEWYGNLDVKHKLYVPGNHDSWIYHNQKASRDEFEDKGIVMLNKEEIVIDGVKFYGDPTTPKFGDWFFTSARHKMHKHWSLIPDDTDVLITHGPPYGILDLNQDLKPVGDKHLETVIQTRLNIKYHLFGHIHDNNKRKNHGILIRDEITYSNASLMRDGQRSLGIVNKGNLIDI